MYNNIIVFLTISLNFKKTELSNVFISKENGKDEDKCGRYSISACKSLVYAITRSAEVPGTGDLTIQIDGGNNVHDPSIYEVNTSFQVDRNLTLKSTGKVCPTIIIPNYHVMSQQYIFNCKEKYTIKVDNIRFYNAPLAYIQSDMTIKLQNSVVESSFSFVQQLQLAKKSYLNMVITNCSFNNSKLDLISTELTIVNSFINGTSVIRASKIAKCNISNCVFKNTKVLLACKAILLRDQVVSISTSRFINTHKFQNAIRNSGCLKVGVILSYFQGHKHTALALSDIFSVTVDRSHFQNNEGFNGGALVVKKSQGEITQCIFFNNSARNGGAVYFMDGIAGLLIKDSRFILNSAIKLGGSIYSSETGKRTDAQLTLYNVTLRGEPTFPTVSGTLIYSTTVTILRKVSMNILLMSRDWSMTDGFSCNMKCINSIAFQEQNFTYVCPINHNALTVLYGNLKRLVALRCLRCKTTTYSINTGMLQIRNRIPGKSTISKNVNICQQCPSGGNCNNGITSRGNFFGYPSPDKSIVSFIPCPHSYCCSPQNVKCVSYNTCNKNRQGVLCGSCKTDYRVNYFDESCVLKRDCKKHTFWLLYLFCVILYMGGLFYYKKVFLYVLKHVTYARKKTYDLDNLTERLIDKDESNSFDYKEEADNIVAISSVIDHEPSKTTMCLREVNMAMNISGVKTILFFFYQVEILLRIDQNYHQEKTFLAIVKKAISSTFNFQIISVTLSRLCPSEVLTRLGKEFIKASTIPAAMVLFVFAFVARKIYLAWRTKKREVKELHKCHTGFQVKIKSSLIHLTLLGYTEISAFCLRMMNCVTINDTHHLYIQGDVVCYSWWQYLIMVFFSIWIVPFPLSTYLSEKMLAEANITNNQFFICFAFPPYTIYCYVAGTQIIPDSMENHSCNERKEREKLIDLFQGPYRQKKTNLHSINWEVIVLFRRLILSVLCVCIVNPVLKTFFTFPMLLLFLLHHWYKQPYFNKSLNRLETGSLSALLLFNVFDLIWALDYMYNLTNLAGFKLINPICAWVRDVILVTPPLVIVLILLSAIVKKLIPIITSCLRKKFN